MAAFWPPLMLTQEQAVEIRVLRRRGLGLRAIARELGCSRTTVKRYLRDEAAARYGPRQPQADEARRAQGVSAGAYCRSAAAVDPGGGLAARDPGARLRRRRHAAEGVYQSDEAGQGRSGGALRDGAGRADAGGLHSHSARPRSVARVRGDAGLQPGHLGAFYDRRGRGDALWLRARGAAVLRRSAAARAVR